MANTIILDKTSDETSPSQNTPSSKKRGKIQILGFNLAGRQFGLDIRGVIEIVRQVAVSVMPEAPEYLEGIIDVRETVVPLINLQKMFKIGNKEHDLKTQIVIVRGKDGDVGFLVDHVTDIISVPKSSVMSPKRGNTPLSRFVSGVVDVQNDLMMLLDADTIIDQDNWGEIVTRETGPNDPQHVESRIDQQVLRQRALDMKRVTKETKSEKRRLVTFTLGNESYGIDIACVKEISDIVEIYFIPSAPVHIVGTINLRGVIVPVIDMCSFFGLQTSPVEGESSIIIAEQDNITLGILVDRIGGIEEVASESVEPPLATIDKDRVDCLEGGVELNGNLLGILRLERIVQVSAAPSS